MELKHFLLEERDGIGIITIHRPEVRNALNTDCQRELIRLMEWANQQEHLGALIITGSGVKAFAAGADIAAIQTRTMTDVLEGVFPKAFQAVAQCDKPVIAAINGAAYGGGCELAVAADIRIAAENAKFAFPEVGIGIMPGGGGTQRLAKLIGLGRAKEMIMTGRVMSAAEALQTGLVTQVVAQDKLMDEAICTAQRILEKGPLAVRMAKKVVGMALSTDEESGRLLELFSYCMLMASHDRLEGCTAFLEKRMPKFTGR